MSQFDLPHHSKEREIVVRNFLAYLEGPLLSMKIPTTKEEGY
jgi:hypothetical protein